MIINVYINVVLTEVRGTFLTSCHSMVVSSFWHEWFLQTVQWTMNMWTMIPAESKPIWNGFEIFLIFFPFFVQTSEASTWPPPCLWPFYVWKCDTHEAHSQQPSVAKNAVFFFLLLLGEILSQHSTNVLLGCVYSSFYISPVKPNLQHMFAWSCCSGLRTLFRWIDPVHPWVFTLLRLQLNGQVGLNHCRLETN